MTEGLARATAVAHPNIALAKYWGKRNVAENLPAVPSLSVTLAGMTTTTSVAFEAEAARDELVLDGRAASDAATIRVARLLDRVRAESGIGLYARVVSDNDFPTAAGLASSASAFAALAVAATHAAGLGWSDARLSDLARKSSVSAARSIFGGFVELSLGNDGEPLSARSVAPAEHWPLRVLVAVTREGPKEVSSTDGMRHTAETSPFFPAWVERAPSLVARVRDAVLRRDLHALGEAAEESALAMHATSLAAAPAIVYWTGATVEVLAEVRRLRRAGTAAYATIDAGPHVKVLTSAEDSAAVASALAAVPGVLRTITASPGGGARLVSSPITAGQTP